MWHYFFWNTICRTTLRRRGSKHVDGEYSSAKICQCCFYDSHAFWKMDTSNKRTFLLYSPIPKMVNVTKKLQKKKKILTKKFLVHRMSSPCLWQKKNNIALHSQTHNLDPSFLYISKLYNVKSLNMQHHSMFLSNFCCARFMVTSSDTNIFH